MYVGQVSPFVSDSPGDPIPRTRNSKALLLEDLFASATRHLRCPYQRLGQPSYILSYRLSSTASSSRTRLLTRFKSVRNLKSSVCSHSVLSVSLTHAKATPTRVP